MLPRRTSLPSAARGAAAARLLSSRFWDFHFVHFDFLTSTQQSCKERIKRENIEYNWSFEDIFMSMEVIYGSPTLNLGDGDAYLGFRNWPHARVLHSLTEQSEIFFAFNKMKWNYFSVLWQAYCHSRLGKKPCSVTPAQHFYILSSIFSPPPTNFYLRENHFSIELFCYLFIWLSLQCSIEQACYTHLIYSWFEGHSISVLMILNHLVGNKICILCNFIPYSCARLHSGLLMISATALCHPLSFNFYPPSFLSLWMKMKNKQRPHDNCNCTRSSFIF